MSTNGPEILKEQPVVSIKKKKKRNNLILPTFVHLNMLVVDSWYEGTFMKSVPKHVSCCHLHQRYMLSINHHVMYLCTFIFKMPVLYKRKIQSCCKWNPFFLFSPESSPLKQATFIFAGMPRVLIQQYQLLYTLVLAETAWVCKLFGSRKGIFHWIFGIFV